MDPHYLVLFHPDYTVGSGIAPDLLTFRKPEALAGSGINPDTAGGELRPALRTKQPYGKQEWYFKLEIMH